MEENEVFETTNDDVIECDAEVMDDSDTEEGSGIAGVAALVGAGIGIGVAVHKWVVPAVGKVAHKAKDGIVNFLTKNDKKYIEVGSEGKNESEDSEN